MGYENYALRGMLNLPRLADHGLASSECPLLAQSGHAELHRTCPLLGAKRTWRFALHMSAFDPKRTLPSSSSSFRAGITGTIIALTRRVEELASHARSQPQNFPA
jgi:hypothetical protein